MTDSATDREKAPPAPRRRGAKTSAAVPHLSVAERVARGKAARARCRGRATPSSSRRRTGPTRSSSARAQAASRVPELVPIRYGRMLVSPFTFYRGAALSWPPIWPRRRASGLQVQPCGDAHLSNFGVFASPERRLVFDINDFDETLPGPWEWDVKRLAASLAVAGRENGYPAGRAQAIVRGAVARTARRCGSSPRCRTSTCGTRGWTSRI